MFYEYASSSLLLWIQADKNVAVSPITAYAYRGRALRSYAFSAALAPRGHCRFGDPSQMRRQNCRSNVV
jgi:hypothetical protein